MTSRSTVTRPVGRDVAKDYCGETLPASPAYQHRDATETDHWRRRVVDVKVILMEMKFGNVRLPPIQPLLQSQLRTW